MCKNTKYIFKGETSLSEKGFENFQKACNHGTGIVVAKEFLVQHYDVFKSYFDDGSYDEYGKNYTFEEECEDGGIFDTSCRDRLKTALGKILTNKDWPINGDSEEYKDCFFNDFVKAIQKTPGIIFEEEV